MSYTYATDLLRKIIKEKEEEGPQEDQSILFKLIHALYLSYELDKEFREYLDKGYREGACGNLFFCSSETLFAIAEAIDDGCIPERLKFTLREMLPQADTLTSSMIEIRRESIHIEDFLKINNFLINHLDKITLELDSLGFVITHPTHPNYKTLFEVVEWWNKKRNK